MRHRVRAHRHRRPLPVAYAEIYDDENGHHRRRGPAPSRRLVLRSRRHRRTGPDISREKRKIPFPVCRRRRRVGRRFPGLAGPLRNRRRALIEELVRARRDERAQPDRDRRPHGHVAVGRRPAGERELDARLSTLERYAAALGRTVELAGPTLGGVAMSTRSARQPRTWPPLPPEPARAAAAPGRPGCPRRGPPRPPRRRPRS